MCFSIDASGLIGSLFLSPSLCALLFSAALFAFVYPGLPWQFWLDNIKLLTVNKTRIVKSHIIVPKCAAVALKPDCRETSIPDST